MDAKVLEALQGEEEVLEIHERCLEDADKRAQQLEVEKRGLEEKVERLEVEGQELRARLEAGAKHYRFDWKLSTHTPHRLPLSCPGSWQQQRRSWRSSKGRGREWPHWKSR